MQNRQIKILGGVFALLLLIVLIFENPFGKDEDEKRTEAAKPLFPDFSIELVSKIEIIAKGQTTILAKQNDQWVVATMENYPADSEGVKDLLEKVTEFDDSRHVSDNPKNQAEYQVDSSGVEAKLLDAEDKTLAHLFVGKNTPGIFNSYVRVADSNDVYVGKGYLQSTFDKGERTWKDRTIFKFEKSHVTSINIVSPEETIELRLDSENKWHLVQPITAAANQTEVENLLSFYSDLKTDDFAEVKELTEYGLDTPTSSITASLNDGTTAKLLIGKEENEGGKLYVKRDDRDTIFMLSKSNVDRMIKASDALTEKTPPPEMEDTNPSE